MYVPVYTDTYLHTCVRAYARVYMHMNDITTHKFVVDVYARAVPTGT
jgi:hypothetical protein